jgi:hypothetical protein
VLSSLPHQVRWVFVNLFFVCTLRCTPHAGRN